MAFDNKSALNHAIRYLTQVAERRAAGGWLPPKERERQQRDAMRQEQQQARQAEREQKEAKREEEKQQKLLSKQFPTQYMPHVGRQVMAQGGDPTPEEYSDFAQQLGSVRQTRVGRTHGRYQEQDPESAIRTMYGDLIGLAREGVAGRKWYENSSKRILDYFHDDKNAADKFAQLIAIYSPQTTVPINTANAIKAYNRAIAGEQLWGGQIIDKDRTFNTIKEANDYVKSLGGLKAGFTKVPLDDSGKRFLIAQHQPGSYENIATADRDLKAHLLMNEGIPFEGRKTNNFYNNLMVHIDPNRLQGSTQDLWMAHAFGFPDVAIGSGSKYDFMEKLTQRLADQLNWKPHQVQAAIWTAIKTRMESVANDAKRAAVERGIAQMVPSEKGKMKFQVNDGMEDKFAELHRDMALGTKVSRKKITESAKDFSDFLDQNLANISWESAPSKHIDHLNGIEDLPMEAKAEYHGLISKALQDENGNDILAKYLGIMSPGSVDATGYWDGKTNPATHLQVGSTRIKGAGQAPDIDEPSKKLMEIYAAAKGLLHKQDGVGYHRPFYNPKVSEANGLEYQFDKDIEPEHIRTIGEALDNAYPGVGLIPVNNRTLRVINFRGPQDELVNERGETYFDDHNPNRELPEGHSFIKTHAFGQGVNWRDQRDFHKSADNVISKVIPDTHTAKSRTFGSDGNLVGNDWRENKNGEDYIRRLSALGRSDVHNFISSVLAPKVEEVDRAFAEKYGLKTNPQIEQSIRQAGQEPEEINRPQFQEGGSVYEPHKRAEEQGYSIKGYHFTRGPRAENIARSGQFDPTKSFNPTEEAAFFWTHPDHANEWAAMHIDPEMKPEHIFDTPTEKHKERMERIKPSILPVRIHPGKHADVNWLDHSDDDVYDSNIMGRLIQNLKNKGYDTARIRNVREPDMYEPYDQIAVLNPAMIRSEFAEFDPKKQGINDIGAARGGMIREKHPALSIAGTHIREEEHGEPMFTGRL